MFIASKLAALCVIEIGGFCMGRAYFMLPKGGCYPKGGGAWYHSGIPLPILVFMRVGVVAYTAND
jgi:hypothetical protein